MTTISGNKMLPIETKLCSLLELGKEPSLVKIGGVESILLYSKKLSSSKLTPELVRIIIVEFEGLPQQDQARLGDFLVQCIENLSDEFCAQEIVDLIDCFEAPPKIEDRFYKSFLKVAQDSTKPAMTRAFALDGSLRLACKKPARKHALFAILLEIDVSDSPLFIKNSAKILGVANSLWSSEEALSVLQGFMVVDEAKSESAYELGMAYLHKGFEAQDRASATNCFSTALFWFRESIKHDEQRLDAELYELSLSILIQYAHGNLEMNILADKADCIQKAVFIYEAWVDSETSRSWLGARRTELANWTILARSLEGLVKYLAQPSWFEPRVVIENHLLKAYTASRSYLYRTVSGGIETIIKPYIEASLIQQEGQLYHLYQWLEQIDHPEWQKVATDLLAKVEDELEIYRENPTKAASYDHRGVALLKNNNAPTPLIEAFEQVVALNRETVSPAFENIFNVCDIALKSNSDYRKKQIRSAFIPVLTLTLKFLESRMDQTQGHHRAVKYLFQTNPLPKEDALQSDYFDFMYGLLMGTTVEVSNIGGGRADVQFQYRGIRIIAELKKEEDNCSFDNLEQCYSTQGVEYQNTNVRLGILLVLDLTKKDGGVSHIESQVKVVDVLRPGEDCPRSLVIVKVPGRRKTPSALSR